MGQRVAVRRDLAERFWEKVCKRSPDDCWEWRARRTWQGYGQFRLSSPGHMVNAHRVAWMITHGSIPAGQQVLHRCDNPPCVNPAHLMLGSNGDNVADRTTKGRSARNRLCGEQNPHARLTWQQVDEMRGRHEAGESFRALGRAYGVSETTVRRAVTRQLWTQRPA